MSLSSLVLLFFLLTIITIIINIIILIIVVVMVISMKLIFFSCYLVSLRSLKSSCGHGSGKVAQWIKARIAQVWISATTLTDRIGKPDWGSSVGMKREEPRRQKSWGQLSCTHSDSNKTIEGISNDMESENQYTRLSAGLHPYSLMCVYVYTHTHVQMRHSKMVYLYNTIQCIQMHT